jgi:hypothetical protein
MARKSIEQLIAQANADFPDNTIGLITPAKLRAWCVDFLTTMSPAYGYLQLVGPASQTFNIAPSLMVFTTATDSDATQTSSVVPASTVTRAEAGVATIVFTANVACAVNRFVTFKLFKNGVATPWSVTATGGGAANPVAVSMTAVDPSTSPGAVYTIRVAAEIDGVACTLTNGFFVVQLEQVRTFA